MEVYNVNIFGRFKDGTELLGETNNELTLTSLTASDDGRYKCLAKSTASDTLPAAVSAEAQLSVTGIPTWKRVPWADQEGGGGQWVGTSSEKSQN